MGKKSRSKRERREQETIDSATWERLIGQAEAAGMVEAGKLKRSQLPESVPKLSDRVLQVARLYTDDLEDEEHIVAAVELATLAWNLSVIPEATQSDLDQLKCKIGVHAWTIVQPLLERKKQMFPDDLRLIVSHEITGQGRDRRLNVLYEPNELM